MIRICCWCDLPGDSTQVVRSTWRDIGTRVTTHTHTHTQIQISQHPSVVQSTLKSCTVAVQCTHWVLALCTYVFISCLARSDKLPTGLYILLVLISFFLFFIFFFMISRRQIISGYAGPIFAIFSPNESVLDSNNRSGLLFLISQGTLPWQPILWKMANSPLSSLWHSEMEWDNAVYMHDLIPTLMPLHPVKFWWRSVQ